MTLDEIIDSVKSVAVKVGTAQIMALAIVAVPPLGWPIIRQVATFIVSNILALFFDKAEFGAFMLRTSAMTTAQAQEYVAAQQKLEEAQDAEAKAKAEAEVIAAARNLIQFAR